MLAVDLHCHSLFSLCGLHTFIELLERGRELGMEALAVTDHGPALGGRINTTFFDRLRDPIPGIRLLKGMECNVLDEQGTIDMRPDLVPFCDVVLVGLHPNLPPCPDRDRNTAMLVEALRRNPYVDIVAHPNSAEFPVDYAILARECVSRGVALEINNSKTTLQRVDDRETLDLIRVCMQVGCRIAVNSDTHALGELGNDSAVRPFLDTSQFPHELIVNRDIRTVSTWLDQRRQNKKPGQAHQPKG